MATLENVRDQVRTAIARADYDQALSLVQLIRRYFPSDFETSVLVGQIHLENGRHAEARDAFESALEIDPENILARSALAIIAEEEGDLDGALEQFERAFDINTANSHVAAEVRRLHSQLRHTRPVDPGSSKYAIARRLLRDKKYDRAIPLFEDALNAGLGEEVAVGMAMALWLGGRPVEAEAAARQILVDLPDCMKALAIRAAAAFSRGDRHALTLLNRTAALNPGNGVARELFKRAGLLFPKIGETVEIPDAEVRSARESARASRETLSSQPDATQEAETSGELEPGFQEGEPQDSRVWQEGQETTEAGAGMETVSAEEAGSAGQLGDRLAASLAGTSSDVEAQVALTEAVAPPTPTVESAAGSDGEVQPSRAYIESGDALAVDGAPRVPTIRESPFLRPKIDAERRGDAALHVYFGRSFEGRGRIDLALEEYRAALRLDAPSTAPAVAEAVLAIAEGDPTNLTARWMAGDALVAQGQLRQAVEQYLVVLHSGRGTHPAGGDIPGPA